MAKISYSNSAIQDLEQIGDYIANTLKSPMAALNTVNRIQDAIDKLEKSPLIGSRLTSFEGTVPDYRYLISGNYLSFYRVQGDMVYIDRVLYGRRDYMKILFGDTTEDNEEPAE